MENNFKNINPFYKLLRFLSVSNETPVRDVITEEPTTDSQIRESVISDVQCKRKTYARTTYRRRNYADYINELVMANERYAYTYISNLSYSEKTYQAFRNAMEITSATPIDLFVHSITFRAEAINNGYQALTEGGNYLCAIALIRMQLDNFLIAWAGLACKNRDEFYVAYQSGKPINKLTDKEGNRLTQNFIVNSYAEIDPLVKEIYKNGNDFIHPSHIFQEQSIDLTNGIRMRSYKEYECPEPMKREAKKHMMIANNLLCNILCRWVQLKHGVDLGISKTEQVENDLGVSDTQEYSPDDLPF